MILTHRNHRIYMVWPGDQSKGRSFNESTHVSSIKKPARKKDKRSTQNTVSSYDEQQIGVMPDKLKTGLRVVLKRLF